MKTIGLVGGTGWVSTVEYYRVINQELNARRGGLSTGTILLHSLDFGEIDACHAAGDFDAVGARVADAARKLERAGADCVLLCANTTHMHAPRVQAAIGVPLIHIVDATAGEARRKGITKVGLMATRLTMEREFYKDRLRGAGLEVVVPGQDERAFIQRTINDELVKSVFLPERKRDFLGIIDRLRAQGAEGVILGCTEIPLLVQQQDAPLPVFDTTRIHALAAVEFALA